MTLTLGDLVQVVENDSRKRGAWPRSPDQAGLGYFYAYGQLLAELESKWQWDTKRGRGRYYRESVKSALTYLLRNYLLLRIAGPLRGVGTDIRVGPLDNIYFSEVPVCLTNMGDMAVMLQRPSLFLGYIFSLCTAHKISYQDVILSLTKEGE